MLQTFYQWVNCAEEYTQFEPLLAKLSELRQAYPNYKLLFA